MKQIMPACRLNTSRCVHVYVSILSARTVVYNVHVCMQQVTFLHFLIQVGITYCYFFLCSNPIDTGIVCVCTWELCWYQKLSFKAELVSYFTSRSLLVSTSAKLELLMYIHVYYVHYFFLNQKLSSHVSLLLQAVYKQDPEYVVQRIESGRYAINTDVREVYMKALSLVMVIFYMIMYMLCSN